MKTYIIILSLIISFPNLLFSQVIGTMQFKDFPIVQNLDSLANAIYIKQTNPEKYMMGLLTLEKSREMIKSYKFGNSLPAIDSLLKMRPLINIKAIYLYFLGINVNLREESNEQSLRYTTTALKLFENLKDTSGIVNCLNKMVQLNISNYGDAKGDLAAAEHYLERLTVLANFSGNVDDQLTALYARQIFDYAHVAVPIPNPANLAAGKKVSLKAIRLINEHPQYAYWKHIFLNFYANLFFIEKNYQKSVELHLQCLNLITSNESNYSIKFNFNLGNDYVALKELKKAENYYLDAIAKKQSTKSGRVQEMSILQNLSNVQFSLKEYDAAWASMNRFVDLKDTVNNQSKTKNFLDLQTKYETDKKEQANLLLQKQKHQYEFGLLLGIILLAIISLLLFYLYRKNKQLDEYGHFRDQIFSIISHDLKSPVAALAGLSKKASYLIRQKETERLEKVSNSIDSSVMQITTLINNLLAWAISQDITVATKMETFPLLPVVEEIIFLYKEVASTKMADIQIDIPENLTLYGNKNGMAVIIRNLIDNALKHTSSTKIRITASKEGTKILFKITNNAVITSPEMVEKIQKQLNGINLNGINTSTGLGLKLVVYFAKQHNASIEMKSNIENGTSFLVRLPQ